MKTERPWPAFAIALVACCAAHLLSAQPFSGSSAATAVSYPVVVPPPAPPEPPSSPLVLAAEPPWRDPAIDVSKPRTQCAARLVNISARALVRSGEEPLIASATITASGTLPTLVRAIGPGLSSYGVEHPLARPHLTVYAGNRSVAAANCLAPSAPAVAAYVGAFPATPSSGGVASGDAALVGEPSEGAISAHCSTEATGSGVALVEFYDSASAPSPGSARFVNLSARATVEPGEAALVIGFNVQGDGVARVLLRGVGPSLAPYITKTALPDPEIDLYSTSGLLASNDNWQQDATVAGEIAAAAASSGAFAFTSPNDAALIVTLPAGSYTFHVRGKAGQTGMALAEIYELAPATSFEAAFAVNQVGLDLLRQLTASGAAKNALVSPYSIESALALAYSGAAGDTRIEMSRALRFPAENAALQTGFSALQSALTDAANQSVAADAARKQAGSPGGDVIQWNVANRLFGQTGYPIRNTFLSLMSDGFGAPLQLLDFQANPEAARLTINAWVEEQTRQKIIDLLPPDGVGRSTRLVLVNALYLKAPWNLPFAKSLTAARPFQLSSAVTQDVTTMAQTESLGYSAENGFKVVTLDYLGGGLQFVIVLPDVTESVDSVAARLTAADLAKWARIGDQKAYVSLTLPKFKIAGNTVDLTPGLMALGMRTAFDVPAGSANFDGIVPRAQFPFAIAAVYHKTYVALDEEGTEAAAATAVVGRATAIGTPPISLDVNRPFLFAIQHRASGACLFLGRIDDPR